jgi:hypothetical protein
MPTISTLCKIVRGPLLCRSLALCIAMTSAPLLAATINVSSLADSGVGTLRAAITSASAADTITFSSGLVGSIELVSTLVIDKSLTIQGNPGIILDGGDAVRVLLVNPGVQATLESLIIQHGLANDGGGILSDGTLQLIRCAVRDNHATDRGGGLFIRAGSYALSSTEVADNEAVAEGGGIGDFSTSASTITNSRISGNMTAGAGAGIRHVSGQLLSINFSTVAGNIISGTTESGLGGGIASQNSPLNISNSTISGNKGYFGGGILVQNAGLSASLNLTASLVAGNTAVSDGGGIFVFGATLNSLNSTFTANLAGAGTGGGLTMQNTSSNTAVVTFTNSTIALNRSASNGGGVTQISGNLTMKNTLVAGNTATTNADVQGTFTSQGYNLVQTRGTSSGYIASDLANSTNPNLLALIFNGGRTNTLALAAASPAINAVPAANCAGITLDQRGYRRPTNNCDIGAFEVEGVPVPNNVFYNGYE